MWRVGYNHSPDDRYVRLGRMRFKNARAIRGLWDLYLLNLCTCILNPHPSMLLTKLGMHSVIQRAAHAVHSKASTSHYFPLPPH